MFVTVQHISSRKYFRHPHLLPLFPPKCYLSWRCVLSTHQVLDVELVSPFHTALMMKLRSDSKLCFFECITVRTDLQEQEWINASNTDYINWVMRMKIYWHNLLIRFYERFIFHSCFLHRNDTSGVYGDGWSSCSYRNTVTKVTTYLPYNVTWEFCEYGLAHPWIKKGKAIPVTGRGGP
jgi:hypothetical protein